MSFKSLQMREKTWLCDKGVPHLLEAVGMGHVETFSFLYDGFWVESMNKYRKAGSFCLGLDHFEPLLSYAGALSRSQLVEV